MRNYAQKCKKHLIIAVSIALCLILSIIAALRLTYHGNANNNDTESSCTAADHINDISSIHQNMEIVEEYLRYAYNKGYLEEGAFIWLKELCNPSYDSSSDGIKQLRNNGIPQEVSDALNGLPKAPTGELVQYVEIYPNYTVFCISPFHNHEFVYSCTGMEPDKEEMKKKYHSEDVAFCYAVGNWFISDPIWNNE